MGQRANLVVVKQGRWRLYYDHWCASRLDVELFWGPQLALEFIKQRPPAGDSAWLDEVWCEGAAIVDLDRQELLFFGGDNILHDVTRRRAQLALMTATWPRWDIRWAYEGIVSIGRCLDLPATRFLTDYRPDAQERFRTLTAYPEDNDVLLTTKIDGETTARRVAGDQESLELGPDHLGVLGEVEGMGAMEWSGEMPGGGVHLDFDRQAISVWWATWAAAVEQRVAAAWPGWSVEWLQDRYEQHIAIAGLDIRFPERALADIQADILQTLTGWCHWEAKNPARDLAKRLDAPVNPQTKETRGSAGDEAQKLRVLSDLSARVPIGDQ